MKFTARFFCMLLAAALLFGLVPSAFADDTSGTLENSMIHWDLDLSTGVLTISGTGKMPYSNLGHPWDTYKHLVKKVIIQYGVENIGYRAFHGCEAMEEIVIPDSVTEINDSAFTYCSSLKAVLLPQNLTNLGSSAFHGCSSLTSIDIPGGVQTIAGFPFQGCSLSSITLHEGLEVIGQNAFRGVGISSISIPSTVKKIGECAFELCSQLTEIHLAEGLEELGYRSFSGTGLKSITLPASLRYITPGAFAFDTPERITVLSQRIQYGADSPYEAACVYAYSGSSTEALWQKNKEFTFRPIYFTDVMPSAWYFDAVRYSKENGLFNGTSQTAFSPSATMTRAMAVTVLHRYAAQLPAPEAEQEPAEAPVFSDVRAGSWYADAVAWAAEHEIVKGVGDGKFNPDGTLTREQLVTILHRFAGWLGDDVSAEGSLDAFSDAADVGSYAQEAALWATRNGIINGVGGGRLDPKGSATRAQVATILMRYIEDVRGAAHPQLYLYADEADLTTLTRLAGEYGRLHPELTIHVAQTDPRSFSTDYLLDGRRDLFFASNENVLHNIHGYNVAERTELRLSSDRLHFAVAAGDPKGIGSWTNLVKLLKYDLVGVGYARASENDSFAYNFARDALQTGGAYFSELQGFSLTPYASTDAVAAALMDGSLDVGTCWQSEIEEYGLTALPDIPFDTDWSFVKYHGSVVLPALTRGHEQAAAFVEWLAAHPESFDA